MQRLENDFSTTCLKKSALPYRNFLNPKPVVKVGVNISPETRTIDGWIVQPD